MKCLNCGNDCDDKYCPKCGQPTSTSRTTWRSFSTSSLADMLRFKGRFLHTCSDLLTHPWTVISNYTAGRRVRYSSPLLFLLTLAIYAALLTSWVGREPSIDRNIYLLRFYEFSSGMFTMCMLPPVILSLRIIYRKQGIRRFNFPELFTAGIFLCALSFLIDIVLLPFSLFMDSIADFSPIIFLIYCSICIFKVFPIRPYIKAIATFILFLILSIVSLTVYIIILEAVPQFIFGTTDAIRSLQS